MRPFLLLAVVVAVLAGGCYYVYEEQQDAGHATVTAEPGICVYADPDGAGTVTILSYTQPTAVYSATAASGQVFIGWYASDGTLLGTADTLTVDITKNASIRAAFSTATASRVYTWACPTAFGTTVATTTLTETLSIEAQDYADSMAQTVRRHATTLVTAPTELVQPSDQYVQQVAAYLTSVTAGYSDLQRLTAVLYWVQTAIPYGYDSTVYGQAEFWACPVECLYNQAGDCEDTAVLFCSLAEAMGFKAALVGFTGHMGAAVAVSGVSGGQTFTGTSGTVYTYCETAVDSPVGIGHIATDFADAEYVLYELEASA